MSQLTIDPDTLEAKNFTIVDLATKLTNLGVALPADLNSKPKLYYFELYKETLREKQRLDQTPPQPSNKNKRTRDALTATTIPPPSFDDDNNDNNGGEQQHQQQQHREGAENHSNKDLSSTPSRPAKKPKKSNEIDLDDDASMVDTVEDYDDDDEDEVLDVDEIPINRHSVAVDTSNQSVLTTTGSGSEMTLDKPSSSAAMARVSVASIPMRTKPISVMSSELATKLNQHQQQPAPVIHANASSPSSSGVGAVSPIVRNTPQSPTMQDFTSPGPLSTPPSSSSSKSGGVSTSATNIDSSPLLGIPMMDSTPTAGTTTTRGTLKGRSSSIGGGRARRLSCLPNNVSVISYGDNLPNCDVSQFVEEADESFSLRKFFIGSLVAVMWAVLILAGYTIIFGTGSYDPSTPRGGVYYCDTEVSGTSIRAQENATVVTQGILGYETVYDCIPCPKHGYCGQGRLLQCAPTFVIQNAICVKDENVELQAAKMIQFLQLELSDLAGQKQCGIYGVTDDRWNKTVVEQKLRNKFLPPLPSSSSSLSNTTVAVATDDATSAEVRDLVFVDSLKLALDMIRESSSNLQLVMEEVDGEYLIRSTVSNMNIVCRARATVITYKYYLIGALVVMLTLIVANVQVEKKRQYQSNVNYLANAAFKAVAETKSRSAARLRDELKENVAERFDLTPEMWEDVREVVRRDKRIQEALENREIVWKYQGDATSSTLNTSSVQL